MIDNQSNIITERYFLRELEEQDATERYLNWFGDSETRRFITTAPSTKKLSDLKQYISERIGRKDILFLGIFEKTSGLHLGNIKYEPVDTQLRYAIMGILIGDTAFRGIGLGPEVLKASAKWLKLHRNIDRIILGVSKNNKSAIRSYEKTGFIITDTPYISKLDPETITMVWSL